MHKQMVQSVYIREHSIRKSLKKIDFKLKLSSKSDFKSNQIIRFIYYFKSRSNQFYVIGSFITCST